MATPTVYDPEADEWEPLSPLPMPRHGLAVADLGRTLYAAAGGPEPGSSLSDLLEAYGPHSK